MSKPENKYRNGTLIWTVMDGDWGNFTREQIAEKLITSVEGISCMLYRIKKETGYDVPYKRKK